MNVLQHIQRLFRDALQGLVADPAPYLAMIKPAQDARFGDYQANCAMSLSKQLGQKPRDTAERIVAALDPGTMLEKPEIAGPGFINLRLRTDWVASQLQRMATDERLGVEPAEKPRTHVIDYSSPNVAKPMHVGHLRSTIIGDSITRLLRFLGNTVIADNHLGDWGTQFGMLLHGYKHLLNDAALKQDPVGEMARLYKAVRNLIRPAEEEDEEAEGAERPVRFTEEEREAARKVLDAVRQETAKLHAGDPVNLSLWQEFMPWCHEEINRVYRRLGVLDFDHVHGESFYNPWLAEVVEDLQRRGIAEESRGAIVVPQGANQPPAIIRKSDGAFTYTTTDLATIRYRMQQWNPDAILYVVDFRQGRHFQQLFDTARRWGFDRVALEHVSFGAVLGPDRRPLRTREGDNTGLLELLDEAIEHAERVYKKNLAERRERGEDVPEMTAEELRVVYEVVGVGAVKYADLSQNRTSDYVFDWDKMLATEGNTATYMQYAYVRTRGIFRKGDEDESPFRTQPPLPTMEAAEERALAIQLLRFNEALNAAAEEYKPNLITAYLWDVSKAYSSFFANCPVLKAPTAALRQSRLLLCDLTARVIQRGLDLLGIRTAERM